MRKIKTSSNYDIKDIDLSDLIVLMSANVEDAYISAGIKDYTKKECFDKGFELAKMQFKNINIRTEWENEK